MQAVKLSTILTIFTLMLNSFAFATTANDEFPGRKKFHSVKYITLKQLQKDYNNTIIVDVRSNYEFNTLRIKKAINIPLFSMSFIKNMKKIRHNNPTRKIITYCNGKTCLKSYKAAKKAAIFGVKNVYAFDAGIFDWAVANPDKTSLLNVSPLDVNKLISKSVFKSKLIDGSKFLEYANRKKGIIMDVRDILQREGVSLAFGHEKRAPLNDQEKIDEVINLALSKHKPLFIYDQTGKQVRWLMYYLEKKAVPEYYFMKGGIRAYQKKMASEFR